MDETAVVVTVPAADAVVSRFRREHTPSGAEGMPAHVTVLFPFVDPARLEAGMLDALGRELAAFPPFELTLAALRRFDGPPAVLYLAPAPSEPFVAMTRALGARFGILPYGGEHADVIPHLTVATRAEPAVFDAIGDEVARELPVRGRVDAAEVWGHDAEGWRLLERVALGSP